MVIDAINNVKVNYRSAATSAKGPDPVPQFNRNSAGRFSSTRSAVPVIRHLPPN